MRFQCPDCEAWQDVVDGAWVTGRGGTDGGPRAEQTCSQCGVLLWLSLDAGTEPPKVLARVSPEEEPRRRTGLGSEGMPGDAPPADGGASGDAAERAGATGASRQASEWAKKDGAAARDPLAAAVDAPLRALLEEVATVRPDARAERLTSSHAQIVAFTSALSGRLWAPAAGVIALGLFAALGVAVVAQRIAPAFALLVAPAVLAALAWVCTLAATAVAQVVHLRLAGRAIGMGRSVRLLFEHGSGAAGSALRVSALGAASATLCVAFALLGVAPGLGGGSGLALTGGLLWLQLGAVMASLGALLATGLVLILHPGLAGLRDVPGARVFGFLLRAFRQDGRALLGRASRPLGGAALLAASLTGLLALALRVVSALNTRLLGAGWQDLLGASPLRVLFGAPELLDPPAALSWGGVGMLVSALAVASVLLGLVAAYVGVSGYLLGRALELERRVRAAAAERR